MAEFHKGEEKTSWAFTSAKLFESGALWVDMKLHGLLPGAATQANTPREDLFRGAKTLWGWSDEDVERYRELVANPEPERWKVKYLRDPAERERYAVRPGPVWLDADGRPFDTTNMTSKASGPGFAIFVMDLEGRVYAGAHRVGLFHHSSFLAGGNVAAAGELRVQNGKLLDVTAKSGHYLPGERETAIFLRELHAAGAVLTGVQVKIWKVNPDFDPDRKRAPQLPHMRFPLLTWIFDAEELRSKGPAAKGRCTGNSF
jgi:hypothetical protein